MNNIADILLRKSSFGTPKVNEAEHFINYVVLNSIPKSLKFHEIREAVQNDQILTRICDVIINNWWRFYKDNNHIKSYYVLRKKLIFGDGVIL